MYVTIDSTLLVSAPPCDSLRARRLARRLLRRAVAHQREAAGNQQALDERLAQRERGTDVRVARLVNWKHDLEKLAARSDDLAHLVGPALAHGRWYRAKERAVVHKVVLRFVREEVTDDDARLRLHALLLEVVFTRLLRGGRDLQACGVLKPIQLRECRNRVSSSTSWNERRHLACAAHAQRWFDPRRVERVSRLKSPDHMPSHRAASEDDVRC